MGHLLGVGDKYAVADNVPIVDGGVALGNYVNPFVFRVLMKADLDDAAIRCLAVCNSDDSFSQQLQAEHVADPAESRFWQTFFLEPFQVDVRECFLQKAAHEKDKTFAVRKKTESNFLVLARKENLPVLARRCSKHMFVRGTIERPFRAQSFVDVVETPGVGRKRKSAQVPTGEEIGEALPSFDFQQLKSPRSLSPFFHLIQEQSTVR